MNVQNKRAMGLLGLIVMVAFIFVACSENPPKEERESAEKAFLAAKAAEKCATLTYTSAEKALLKARRLTTEKKYDEARKYFNVAANLSNKAKAEAEANEECMHPKPNIESAQDDTSSDTGPVGYATPTDNPEYTLRRIHFPFNSDDITEEAKVILADNADWMMKHQKARIVIEGHCDDRGSTEYNLALGERRAQAVKKYLTVLGVDPDALDVMSYGEEQPLVLESNDAAWEQNRRAEFRKIWD